MEKVNFRIKLNNDKRAVSFRNIEALTSSKHYVITQKGVRTMIRQFLKSTNKKVYDYPISFKYHKNTNALDVKFNGITGDELRELLTKLGQFTSGNSFYDVSTDYLITFQLRNLAIFNGTPNTKSTTKQAPESAPQSSSGLPKATRIYIHTHEGTGEFDNTIFKTWSDLQNALKKIYDNWSNNPIGYDKVKVEIEWENGKRLIDRVDVGSNFTDDFNPYEKIISDYLKIKDYTRFETNFQGRPSKDDRDSVSWTDEAQSQSSSTQQPEEQPEQQPMETNKLPISYIEIYDAKKSKLLKSFTNWTDADNYFESIWTKMKPQTTKDYSVYIYWGGVQVSAHTIVTLNSDEYYPDGNDEFYDRFLVNWFYSYKDTDEWKNVRDTLQWTDSEETPDATPQSQPQQQEQQPQTQPQTPPQQQPNMNYNYILNKHQIETIYGSNWREDLDIIEELDIYLGDELFQDSIDILKSGENLPLQVDDLGTFDIKIEATTLACYHDYNDYSAEEIQEIIDGLEIYLNLNVATQTQIQEAIKLMELLKLFKNINK